MEGICSIFFKISVCFPLLFLFCRLLFELLVQLVVQSVRTDPIHTFKPVPSNLLLDLNLNMNLYPETMAHDNMSNVKYKQILYMNQFCFSHLNKLASVTLFSK